MAAFARILAVWSQSPHFILNTTVFQRAPLHPEVYQLVGDFTSILLLEIHDDGTDPLDVLARRIGLQFRSDLEHRDYSGLQLMQELAKQGDPDGLPSMPVVFTSALAQSMPGWRSVDQFGEVAYGITQTPQVYLDHQVYQRGGSLHLTWDAVEELFPTGLLDDMFSAYTTYCAVWRRTILRGTRLRRACCCPRSWRSALLPTRLRLGFRADCCIRPFLSRCANGRIRPLSSRLNDASPMRSSTNTLSVSPEDCDDWARALTGSWRSSWKRVGSK